MRQEARTELRRKLFHFLSLIYLLLYRCLGAYASRVLGLCAVLAGAAEAARLHWPGLNAFLIRAFGGVHRPEEEREVSGIFWTALGSWLTVWLFGREARAVEASLLYLALGDGAAGIVGKAWGRHRLRLAGRDKSVEGSSACLAACLVCGAAVGLRGPALWAGAGTATLLELLPLPFNDNLWLPLGSGLVLSFFR